ncbi:MAG: sulfotransferase [Phycisphaerae bacterium]|nr:sulfotransferase [Phycisphaerae bacterium]
MSDATDQGPDSFSADTPRPGGGAPRKPKVAPDPRLEHAVAMENAGDAPAAEMAYKAELAGDPLFGLAHAGLGALYLRLRRLDDAIASLREAVRLLPTNASALGSLAMALLRRGRAAEARPLAKKLTEMTPQSQPAYVLLADCCYAARDQAGIIETYTAAHQAMPTNADVVFHLIKALLNANKNERAERVLTAAFEKMEATPVLLGLLGDAYYRQGKLPEAEQVLAQSLEADASCQYALSTLARIRSAENKTEEAAGYLERLTPPLEPSSVVILAQVRRRQKRVDEAVRVIEELLARPGQQAHALAASRFVLGSIREEQERFDEAFKLYKDANESSLARFDKEALRRFTDSLIEVYNAWRAPTYARGDGTEVPIFIVGMPRSGTSLVEQILASHPEVFAAGELSDIEIMAARTPRRLGISSGAYPSFMATLTREQVITAGRPYLDRVRATAPRATRHTDKMPHNFRHVGFIWQLFPNARIIHCRRDPIDTCLSCYSISFSATHAYSNTLEGLAFMYGEYRRLMQHWRTALPLNLLEVGYEDLVHSPEEWSRKIVDFAGLAWNEKCLDFHKTKRAVLTASVDQVRRPVYDSSIGRWKKFEKHLGPLIDAMGDLAHVPG